MKHSIILIKSISDDNTSSCCSGVDGSSQPTDKDSFKTLYSHIKENHSEIASLDVLDPRNSFLIFILIKDFLRFKVPILKSLKTLFTYSVPSVILNGQVVSKSIPSPEDFDKFLNK